MNREEGVMIITIIADSHDYFTLNRHDVCTARQCVLCISILYHMDTNQHSIESYSNIFIRKWGQMK
jgi:hypothetical protein